MPDYRLIGDEFRDAGSNKVFVAGHPTATGRLSGIFVKDTICSVWTLAEETSSTWCLIAIGGKRSKPPACGSRGLDGALRVRPPPAVAL